MQWPQCAVDTSVICSCTKEKRYSDRYEARPRLDGRTDELDAESVCQEQHHYASCLFFFFQAEDGIRDVAVTGVQTCALPISIGTETWGSIICPSAFCGVSGLRPTYGRVSRYGAMALAPSMDKIGPMARSAEDCARIFAAIAGHDLKDRGTVPIDKGAFTYSPSMELHSRPLKIGWLTNAWKSLAPGVAKPIETASRVLKRYFSSLKDVALPVGPWEDAGNIIVAVESAASFRSLIRSGRVSELTDPLGQIAGYVNEQYSAADYLQALK